MVYGIQFGWGVKNQEIVGSGGVEELLDSLSTVGMNWKGRSLVGYIWKTGEETS